MSALLRLWAREPAVVTGLVAALVSLAAGFGLGQNTAGLIMAAVSAVSAVVVRSQVSPTSSVPPLVTTPVAPPVNPSPVP